MNSNTKGNFLQGRFFGLIGIILLLVAPLPMPTYQQHILVLVLFYAYCASCWNIVCGFVGTLSLGHAVFLGLGAYISTVLLQQLSLSPWIGMFVGAIITCIFGVIIGYPCFRLSGPYFALTTIALGELLRIWVENNEYLFGVYIGGSRGLLLEQTGYQPVAFEFNGKIPYYYVMLVFLAVILYVTYRIKNSKIGYYLVAIRSDPDAAESLGVPLAKYKLIAMAISCFMMAFAGTFYAQFFRYIGPTRIFGHALSVQIALIALVGGQGTVFGPLFGSLLLVPVTEFLSEHFGGELPGLNLFIYGVVTMLVVFYMPKGIHDYIVRFFSWLERLIGISKKPEKQKA